MKDKEKKAKKNKQFALKQLSGRAAHSRLGSGRNSKQELPETFQVETENVQ